MRLPPQSFFAGFFGARFFAVFGAPDLGDFTDFLGAFFVVFFAAIVTSVVPGSVTARFPFVSFGASLDAEVSIMSWSISATGPKTEALETIRAQAAAVPYKPGTPEGDDVVAALARIEALAEALAPTEKISLSANGSHSTTSEGIVGASFSVSVSKSS